MNIDDPVTAEHFFGFFILVPYFILKVVILVKFRYTKTHFRHQYWPAYLENIRFIAPHFETFTPFWPLFQLWESMPGDVI